MSESENKVFFSKINDPKTCSSLEEMSAQDVADLINKLQNENNLLKRKLEKAIEQRNEYLILYFSDLEIEEDWVRSNKIAFLNKDIEDFK